MLFLKAYFDGSGHIKDPNLHFTGMAGFVAPKRIWEDVQGKWNAIACDYSLREPFHMRHFAHSLGQFKGWEKRRKESLYRSLIQILVESEAMPTGCIVSGAAFQSLNARQQAALKSPYFTAMQECIRGACSQAIALEPETVDIVFAKQLDYGTLDAKGEENRENSGTTERLFYAIKHNVPQLGRYMGTYESGEPATMIPLQAADILAYEITKEYENLITSKRAIRRSYQELMRTGGHRPLVKFLHRLALLNVLKESGFPDEEGFEEIDENNVEQIFALHSAQIILEGRRDPGAFNNSGPKWLIEEIQRRWS